MIKKNITLELNNDAPSSKLLGIQVDINLEDKNKSLGETKEERLDKHLCQH